MFGVKWGMRVLITGSSGSGKTYLAKEFQKIGLNAVDADTIEDLHGWFDGDGNKVKFPEVADEEFLDNHQFLWDKNYLKKYLEDKKDIYMFGLSGNIFEMRDCFDKVYFLDVPDEIILERLKMNDRENPMGKTEYQQKVVLEYAHQIKEKAVRLGIKMIDGARDTEDIAKLCFY